MAENKRNFEQFKVDQNENSNIKNIIAITSAKGGVGKSSITSLLAVLLNRKGYKVAILDGDITGPSIPKAFGLNDNATGSEKGINPEITKSGIKVMSLNLLLKESTDPVIWRSSIVTGVLKQFYSEVFWGDIDYMLIDMPPGTSDVPLTAFQSFPIKGCVIVTSPQDLVSMIVEKSINMTKMVGVPVISLVENMSFFIAPDTGKKYEIFGKGKTDEIAKKYGIDTVAKLKIDPKLRELVDNGEIEKADILELDEVVKKIESI